MYVIVTSINHILKCFTRDCVCVVSVGCLSVHGEWNKLHTLLQWCQLCQWCTARKLHLCLCNRVYWTVLWRRSDSIYPYITQKRSAKCLQSFMIVPRCTVWVKKVAPQNFLWYFRMRWTYVIENFLDCYPVIFLHVYHICPFIWFIYLFIFV